MRFLVLFCFVLAASGINAYVAEVTDILKHTKKMNEYVTECIEESKLELSTAVVIDELLDDQRTKDKIGMEQVTRCLFHKADILEPDGKLNSNAAMAILTLTGVEKSDAEELLQKCKSIAGFDAKDMVYAIFKCFDGGAFRRP